MPYTLLISLSSLLLFTGCMGTPKPKEHTKLHPYKTLQQHCQVNPPKTLEAECSTFVADLDQEVELLDTMREIRGDAKEEPEYISLADKESSLILKIEQDRQSLAASCQNQMGNIVKHDDINSADFCLLFDENSITLQEYQYLKKYTPRFDNNPQYIAFEKAYSQKKIQEGLKAMNLGHKKDALKAFKVAASAHNPEADYLIGVIYEEKQIKKAIQWHKKAVEAGVNLSKVNLARLYLRIKLPKQARSWYLSAAKDGNALAQYRLFKMEAKSKSRKAREEAGKWLERSAENNYPQAQYIYGLQLMKQKKNDKAINWLEKAHTNGMQESKFFLGKLYFEEEQYLKAYHYLSQATDKGEANFLLAKMFEQGLGVKKNRVLSYRYYKKAHEQGQDNHIADMKRLQKHLTKKERVAAKYVGKKEAKRRRDIAKKCGPLVNDKNVKKAKHTVHIIGVGVKPIQEANGILVYGEHEKLYYIIAPELVATLKDYEHVDIKAKATAKAVKISSDTGTLQDVYQFYSPKKCSN